MVQKPANGEKLRFRSFENTHSHDIHLRTWCCMQSLLLDNTYCDIIDGSKDIRDILCSIKLLLLIFCVDAYTSTSSKKTKSF